MGSITAMTTAATLATLAPSHHLGISSLVRLLTIGIGLMVAEALENRIEELQRE